MRTAQRVEGRGGETDRGGRYVVRRGRYDIVNEPGSVTGTLKATARASGRQSTLLVSTSVGSLAPLLDDEGGTHAVELFSGVEGLKVTYHCHYWKRPGTVCKTLCRHGPCVVYELFVLLEGSSVVSFLTLKVVGPLGPEGTTRTPVSTSYTPVLVVWVSLRPLPTLGE